MKRAFFLIAMLSNIKMSKERPIIHLDAPDVGSVEKDKVCQAIDAGYVSTFGPLVGEFEKDFARRVGVSRAVALCSGTAALHMALHVLGIGPGDEVIIPATTFAATLHAVMYVKANPVIVDIDPDTWCMSPQSFSQAISPRTKAVIPVHLYGNVCDMSAINTIALSHGIKVIEDATEALGATLQGRHAGTWGDIGCYSFNGNKLMTTGSGGMLVSQDQGLLDRVVYLINQSNPREGFGAFQEVGFNYRMPNLNAALGMAQHSRFDSFIKLKRAFYQIYKNELDQCEGCMTQKFYPGADPSWWFSVAKFKDARQVQLVQEHLKNIQIPTRKVFIPLHTLPYTKGLERGNMDQAKMLYDQALCLPSSTLNTESIVKDVCLAIKEALIRK